MKALRILLLVALGLVLATGLMACGDDNSYNSVWGNVFTSDNNPVHGATVLLSQNPNFSATTNSSGYYYISGFPDGTYDILATYGQLTGEISRLSFSSTHHDGFNIYIN
jgi:hypothetical protein